jgi:ATP-dependent exoDNAse (exonuclease V) alpha subunit
MPGESLLLQFPFDPTPGQAELFEKLEFFLQDKSRLRPVFLLRGYAGTGKTTVISTLVNSLRQFNYKYVLLAPTGRAAKVMSNYSQKRAYTIHKKIYFQKSDPYTGNLVFERQKNYHQNTIFIVDEASMIADEADFVGSKGLLTDLVEYVFENEDNKILLVGDAAQLPPVGFADSPALDADYLRRTFDVSVAEKELTQVTRQQAGSGILFNATQLRNLLSQAKLNISFTTKGFQDVYKMTGEKLEDGLRYAYQKYGRESAIILCRSNKSAVQYNEFIRRQIHFTENEIDVGDLLMIVRNNYTTLDAEAPAGFLANGDFVEIIKIIRFQEMHGLRFADVRLRLTDYEEQPPFDAKIMLDTLHSPTPSMGQEENRKLYEKVINDYVYIKGKKDRQEAVRNDPYLGALQVKFAYALTCHKSQGGQWNAVFVDQGYVTEENLNTDFLRWLYTACTRATDELFLMNFNERFFMNYEL